MKHEDRMRLYTAGLTDKEIATKLGVTKSVIAYWRRKNGLKYNGPGREMGKELQKRRMELWKSGLTDTEIAQKEGVAVPTISSWRHKMGRLKPNKAPKGRKRQAKQAQCLTCSCATAVLCPFISKLDPVAGLKAVGVKPSGVDVRLTTSGKVYTVLKCPQYKRGPLPPPAWKVVG